jgi:signal transduction histidine kinase
MRERVSGGRGAVARLRRVPLLSGLPAADLAVLAQRLTRVRLPAGGTLMREGEAADALYILVSGALETSVRAASEEVLLARHRPGAFVGEMALLGSAPRTATVRAARDAVLLRMEAAEFRGLVATRPKIALRVLQAVGRRLAVTEATLLRRESLASLGTLAAGLAHELNNPAAAVSATAARLATRVEQLERRAMRLGGRGITQPVEAVLAVSAPPPDRSDVADPELRIGAFLRSRDVPGAASGAHALAAGGWSESRLAQLVAGLEPSDARLLLEWLEVHSDVVAMLAELRVSADAIGGVVAAVRSHVRRDALPRRAVDVQRSVEAAVLLLRSRWQGRAQIRVDAAPDLPRPAANEGELTQVWANLIGNAVEAGARHIRVRITPLQERLAVVISDDGRGMPPAVRRRAFEPFFTTKATEGGSGLGLHIVRSIILAHGGRIDMRSRPGRTTFRITLPVRGMATEVA